MPDIIEMTENEIEFYPMSKKPSPDEKDSSFSKTVIMYSDKLDVVGLGYFDFEVNEWMHLNDNNYLLKCWCYIPEPFVDIRENAWPAIALKGYKKSYI